MPGALVDAELWRLTAPPPPSPWPSPPPSLPAPFPDYRNKLKWLEFMQKKHNTNPRRGGPFHHRAPSRVFWRAVRGMIPHKTERGAAALEKLKVFEGIPAPYDKKKRMVVPGALTIKSLKPGREFCNLGKLASEVGWKHHELIQRLETARKASSEKFYKQKRLAVAAIAKAKASA